MILNYGMKMVCESSTTEVGRVARNEDLRAIAGLAARI